MQVRIFTLPLMPDPVLLDELNHFLRANKVIDVKKELAILDGNSCWTMCVTYMDTQNSSASLGSKNNKIDYKEVLDEDTFSKFSLLRKARKQIAEAEAIPAYAIFTDAELAEIAKLDAITPHTLGTIPGIGKKKVDKYSEVLMSLYSNVSNETEGILD